MAISSTPIGVSVAPRHMHFKVDQDLETLWHGGDVFCTAFFNALSLQFPDGEQQFINAVRFYRDQVNDPKLKGEIRGFIGQDLRGKPGVIRKCMPHFFAYLKKGFHPWQHDNRDLIDKNLSDLELKQ